MNISGLSKAAVLAVLYNSSRPQGMGFRRYAAKPMTEQDAQRIIDSGQLDFDYLQGRVMKIDLRSDEIETWLYNRDNGEGAAEKAVDTLRRTGKVYTDEVHDQHESGKMEAAREGEDMLKDSDEEITDQGVVGSGPLRGFRAFKMGVPGKKEDLQRDIDRATGGRHRR